MIFKLGLLALILFAILLGAGVAMAQSTGLEEAVESDGQVMPQSAFTAVQRSAIYNAAARQSARSGSRDIAATIGAPVPPSVPLDDLPDQATVDGVGAGLLKYAMVEGDVVVVDPVRMRVIDVIHRSADRP